MSVVLETTVGDLTIDLFTDDRPRSSLNFLKLCKVKYYNFCLFHKIERNFTAQTGDPTGTGRGGEAVFSQLYGEQAKFFEAETKPRMKHIEAGTVSMINNGDNMHGSQFFITLGEDLDFLDGLHTVFGRVSEGLDILMKMNDTICDSENRPYKDIRITHTVVLDDPFDDPPGLIVPGSSPEPSMEQLRTSRIGVDEEIDDTKGRTLDEIEEEIRDKEAKSRATILEMVGDIPDAEVKPPDNVLFICKLNPVTTAEDLEVIFSRFGSILSCEVIKDRKSGESLQYAFIEFDNPDECENAYFKMDNVLIDDRRIHVDFSQSVAKLSWQEMRKNAQTTFKKPQFKVKSQIPQQKDSKYDLIFEDNIDKAEKNKNKQSRQKDSPHRSSRDKGRNEISRSKGSSHKNTSSRSSPKQRKRDSRSRSRDRNHSKKHRESSGSTKRDRVRYSPPPPRRSKSNRYSPSPPRKSKSDRYSVSPPRKSRTDKYSSSPPRKSKSDRYSPSPPQKSKSDMYSRRQSSSDRRDNKNPKHAHKKYRH